MGAGYSGTPLPKKLGLKDGQRVVFVGLPEQLSHLAESADFTSSKVLSAASKAFPANLDVVHVFTRDAALLDRMLDLGRKSIVPNGMIWVSWPKKSAKVPTDITEGVIRAMALQKGLVDVKVCAVDEIWSGLKLVIPKALR
jgi:hypothetical protein